MDNIIKYPRTPHLVGSRLQAGDEDLAALPFARVLGHYAVIEEKVDGANVAVSFTEEGEMLLQSRGHYLTGGGRERHYDRFKVWAAERREVLFSLLSDRYIMYGEWLYPKHKVYYDALPDFFLEFDILEKETGRFLDTESRHALLKDTGIYSVPVLASGVFTREKDILKYLSRSLYVTDAPLDALREECEKLSLDYDTILAETDGSTLAEGLYIKIEENGSVSDRMKYVRHGYTQTAAVSDSEWKHRPVIPNRKRRA